MSFHMETAGLGAAKVLRVCRASPPLNPRPPTKVERHHAEVTENSIFTDQTDKYEVAIVTEMTLAQAKARKSNEH